MWGQLCGPFNSQLVGFGELTMIYRSHRKKIARSLSMMGSWKCIYSSKFRALQLHLVLGPQQKLSQIYLITCFIYLFLLGDILKEKVAAPSVFFFFKWYIRPHDWLVLRYREKNKQLSKPEFESCQIQTINYCFWKDLNSGLSVMYAKPSLLFRKIVLCTHH